MGNYSFEGVFWFVGGGGGGVKEIFVWLGGFEGEGILPKINKNLSRPIKRFSSAINGIFGYRHLDRQTNIMLLLSRYIMFALVIIILFVSPS